MKTKHKLFFVFFMISFTFFCQEKYEYYGAVKLNGNAETLISYRIVFTETNGVIKGYSVTDLSGEHETKNIIEGTYDAKSKLLTFKEKDIIYTKSPISDDMFCFINFSGTVKLINDNSKVEGDFKGLYKNNKPCINGTLTLIGSNKLYKILNKVNKKVQKSKKIDEQSKEKINPIAILDSIKTNNLTKNQNLNIFVSSKKVKVEIWDNGKEDGDMINLDLNNKRLLTAFKISNQKKVLDLNIGANDVFTITAVNEGEVGPNTATIRITAEERNVELVSNLKKDEKAHITLITRKAE